MPFCTVWCVGHQAASARQATVSISSPPPFLLDNHVNLDLLRRLLPSDDGRRVPTDVANQFRAEMFLHQCVTNHGPQACPGILVKGSGKDRFRRGPPFTETADHSQARCAQQGMTQRAGVLIAQNGLGNKRPGTDRHMFFNPDQLKNIDQMLLRFRQRNRQSFIKAGGSYIAIFF